MTYPLSLVNILTVIAASACLWAAVPEAQGKSQKLWRVAVPPFLATLVALVLLAGACAHAPGASGKIAREQRTCSGDVGLAGQGPLGKEAGNRIEQGCRDDADRDHRAINRRLRPHHAPHLVSLHADRAAAAGG